MKIAIAADHAGVSLKRRLREVLRRKGHEIVDLGTDSEESVDYPDYARAVAVKVAEGAVDRGILICSTGVGMSIAANKVPGIRAALAVNPEEVRLTRAHNDANVLTIGAKFTPDSEAERMVDTFLATEFEAGRHARRLKKISELEHVSK
ncbi:MAG TPA: ribose 5-phosphate isomerase B [Bryobacteraceae bacterium]|nr:ribose 5-phosphate isomerase B [Bryobacteraceae bacterium]